MDTEPTPVAAPGADADSVTLAGRYRIFPGMPRPELASPAVPAFAAVDSHKEGRLLVALLPPRHLALREEALGIVRRLDRAPVMAPVEWGPVDWLGGGQRPVVVFAAPGGGRLMAAAGEPIPPLSEDALVRKVLRPLSVALKELREARLVHGGIRPDNLFYRDSAAGEAVLGDGCTTPPSFAQPVAFVSIEDGMANPAGRGGDFVADLYALGATLAALLLGHRPGSQLDDDALIAAKIGQGSFAALIGQLRLSTTMTEVLRGLLCDDRAERWTLDDLDLWFDGRRLTPRSPGLAQQAARPLVFEGVEYLTRPALAQAFARNWERAVVAVQDGDIEPWLRRSLGDVERANLVAADLAAAGAESEGVSGDRLLARVLVALDPAAPLRYRDVASRIGSLGPALADDFDRPDRVKVFAEMIRNKLPQLWMQTQAAVLPEFVGLRKIFDKLDFIIDKHGPGYGIERCLYELNPALPCRSPLVEQQCVVSLKTLLPALDRAAAANAGSEPVDRHIAAFVAARIGWSIDRDLAGLAATDNPTQRRLSILRLLALVQQAAPTDGLTGLGAWVVALLDPIVESYHYRPFKDSLRKQLGPLARQGRFAEIVALIDNPETLRRDRHGFALARRHYAAAQRETVWLAEGGLSAPERVQLAAHRAAAVTCATIGGLTLAGVALFLVA
ncbi:MAG: serine/threonine protein kinase [Dongiaceae bacterium]